MSGKFIYPPPNSDTSVLTYNYIDSVEVSWETTVANTSETFLNLWYYLYGDPWALGYNESVPVNGTRTVNLNILDEGYYGQFNLDFGATTEYLSVFFNVDYNTTQNPVTWTDGGSSTIISSASSSTTTSASKSTSSSSTSTSTTTTSSSTITSAASSSTASPSSSSSSSSSSSGLSTGATAGIAVGVVLGVLGLVGLGVFFFWRRRKHALMNETSHELPDTYSSQPPPFRGQPTEAEKIHRLPPQELAQNARCGELEGGGLQELPA